MRGDERVDDAEQLLLGLGWHALDLFDAAFQAQKTGVRVELFFLRAPMYSWPLPMTARQLTKPRTSTGQLKLDTKSRKVIW